MARKSVINRGTRDNPKWYVRYRGSDGKWTMKLSGQPTKQMAEEYLATIVAGLAAGKVGLVRPGTGDRCGKLLESWLASIRNRNAQDDRQRVRKHLVPVFKDSKIDEVTLPAVLRWIDKQRAVTVGKLSESSIRHNLNLLSRFFSWAIERGHTTINPVKMIPTSKRPQEAQARDVPWLADEDQVSGLVAALPTPINFMFYLGNRSGLRTGEICGLRMSDLAFIDEGAIRVRYSYDGPLKEDKHSDGKVKWVPAADDTRATLSAWIAKREAQGAEDEDFVFPSPEGWQDPAINWKVYLARVWGAVASAQEIELTWYQATRHSFVSRNLAGGASLDEVSAAVGHSSPGVTKRYYDHFIRKTFSAGLRAALTPAKPAETPPAGAP